MTFLTSSLQISRRTPSVTLLPAAVHSRSRVGCPLWRDWLAGSYSRPDILLTKHLLKKFEVAAQLFRLPLTGEPLAALVFDCPSSFALGRVTHESWQQPCSGHSPKQYLHSLLLSACFGGYSFNWSIPRIVHSNLSFQTLRRLSWCYCQKAVI